MVYNRNMKTADVLDRFKTRADVARLLNLTQMAVRKWGDVVPLESAIALELATGGELKVGLDDYPRLVEARAFARSQGHRLVGRLSVLAA